MKILEKYILKSFVSSFLFCITLLIVLGIIGDILGFLDDIFKHDIPLGSIMAFYFYLAPFAFVNMLPFACLLSAVYVFNTLSKNHEVTAVVASGLSLWELLRPVLLVTFLFCLVAFIVNDRVVPSTMEKSNRIKKEELQTEKEPVVPVLESPPAIIEKQDSSIQPEALLNKTVYESAETVIDESDPPHHEAEIIAEDLKVEPEKGVKVQEVTSWTDSHAVQQEEGVNLPGTLQIAYPRYQENAPPNYPALARKRGQEGAVILQVLVNREGRVDELEIDTSSDFTLLDRAALSAVRKWSFEPGRRGEERIPMWVKVP